MPDDAQRAGGNRAMTPTRHGTALHDAFAETRAAWPGLGLYERFEQIVCLGPVLRSGIPEVFRE